MMEDFMGQEAAFEVDLEGWVEFGYRWDWSMRE
jgi:hypothetical protein